MDELDEVGHDESELTHALVNENVVIRDLCRMIASYACAPSGRLPCHAGGVSSVLSLSGQMMESKDWSDLRPHLHRGQIGLLRVPFQCREIVFVVMESPPSFLFGPIRMGFVPLLVSFLPLRRCHDRVAKGTEPKIAVDLSDYETDRLPIYSLHVHPLSMVCFDQNDGNRLESINVYAREESTRRPFIIQFVELSCHGGRHWSWLSSHFSAPNDPEQFNQWKTKLATFLQNNQPKTIL